MTKHPNKRLLLCTDMDRTVIPNGPQPEAAGARQRLHACCSQEGVDLVYVTGRDIELVRQAIQEFDLPNPAYAITDVGTTIHSFAADASHVSAAWHSQLAKEWEDLDRGRMARELDPDHRWRMQEDARQGEFKVSFYTPADPDLGEQVQEKIAAAGWPVQAVWSVDEASGTGLLDLLPKGANKYLAIVFLQQVLGHADDEILFAGDSGNDLQVLTSPLPSVLVGNATDAIRSLAITGAQRAGTQASLYCAKAVYADGVLEGVAHFGKADGDRERK